MKKVLMLVVMLVMAVVVFAQNRGQNGKKDAVQTPAPTVKTTGVQGNLTELIGLLGQAKTEIMKLEEGKESTAGKSNSIWYATKYIQEAKDLLDKYDYPNEAQILHQVLDLEQRLFKVVMDL